MAKKVSEISNPFSTGQGGANFENNVQAVFVLSLLIDGFSPVLELPIKRVCLQAKRLGFEVDDLVVYAGEKGETERKLICQIKHSVVASKSNEIFKDVIRAAWHDYNASVFDKKRDCIVLAVHYIADQSKKAMHLIHSHAIASADAKDFMQRFEVSGFIDKKAKDIIDAIKDIIKEFNHQKYPTDDELWEFCKVFSLLLFDLDYTESINRILLESLIKSKCVEKPELVWGRLINYVASYNQYGAVFEKDSIDDSIKQYFSIKSTSSTLPQPTPVTGVDLFMISLVLIGSWNEKNEFDRVVIEKISGLEYKDYESKARDMLLKNPDYLSLNNGIWKVENRGTLFVQCIEKLFDDKIQIIFEVSTDIFEQDNKPPSENKPFYPFLQQQCYKHSYEIRRGIASGICMLCNSNLEQSHCNVEKVKSLSVVFVRTLLKDCVWERWISIKDNLQMLAEINPKVFLECVEKNIIYTPDEMLKLFPSSDTGLFGSNNYIVELLWCLEKLAWIPEYLVTSIRCLGLLENLAYKKTNWSNTPINSIVSILLPWHPQTLADVETRRLALICLKQDNEEVLWNVLLKLLPNETISTMEHSKPMFIPINISEEKQPDINQLRSEYQFNMDLAVGLAKNRIDRLVLLIDKIKIMKESSVKEILDMLDTLLIDASSEEALMVWIKLEEQLAQMQSDEVQWPEGLVERIDDVRLKAEPVDIRIKYRRFYLQKRFTFEKGDFSTIWDYLENKKQIAVKEIYDKYGIAQTELFGKSVENVSDVANKLGISISVSELSDTINLYHDNEIGEEFFESCINGFVNKYGASHLLETTLGKYEELFIADVLVMIRYTSKLYDVVKQLLTNELLYWEKASFMYVYTEGRADNINYVVDKLIECKRYITAINILGHSELKYEIGKEKCANLLRRGGLEKSIGTEKLDSYAVQRLIRWLQEDKTFNIEWLSELEYIYLPILNEHSEVQPRALNTRLNLEPEYFCDMIELFFKKHSHSDEALKLSEGARQRLYSILFQYKNVPGTDWNGKFDTEVFANWINKVKEWSTENDRYIVSMQTIGSGLSYAQLDENGLPSEEIMKELDRLENDEMRVGYRIGIINQRGVHFVDPEGKPEMELAKKYSEKAKLALTKGYSRFSEVLNEISDIYTQEAKHNIESMRRT